jgi:hypothetical protein
VPKPSEPPKRPRGRPVTGRPPKRNMTLRLSPDVADYLDTVAKKADTVDAAVRSTDGYKQQTEGKPCHIIARSKRSKTMEKFEPKMMMMIGDVGSKRLEFSTVLSQKEFSELIRETNRIFSFALRTWNPETGDAVIELVPGNGMALITTGGGLDITDPLRESPEVREAYHRSRRKFYKDLLHAIGRSIDESTESGPEQDPSPTLPPERPQLG